MTIKLPELWLQYAYDDLQSAQVLLKIDSRYPADFGIFDLAGHCNHMQHLRPQRKHYLLFCFKDL